MSGTEIYGVNSWSARPIFHIMARFAGIIVLLWIVATRKFKLRRTCADSSCLQLTIESGWARINVVSPTMWACGAAGSALPWHGRGRRFDPDQVHQRFPLMFVVYVLQSERTERFYVGCLSGWRSTIAGKPFLLAVADLGNSFIKKSIQL